ncbi:MAG: hypothetical protein AAF907_02330, partial [Planctomycetota bacterium]
MSASAVDPLFPVLLRRLRTLPIDPSPSPVPAAVRADLAAKRGALLAELASLGFRLENPAALTAEATAGVLARHAELMSVLSAMKGANVSYVPLFQGFPESTPDDGEYFARRIVGFLMREFEFSAPEEIPAELFDPTEFGADPISQMQRDDLFEAGKARQAGLSADGHVEWTTLTVRPRDEAERAARDWLHQTLSGQASVPTALRPDLAVTLAHFGVGDLSPTDVPFGETRA